ncbi:MAG: hypothetical protein OHK0053_05870 [Microscillaceae bacterium]
MQLKNLLKPIFSSLVLMVAFGWVISMPALAFNEELTFFKGTWPEALKEAKKQNKVLFVDAYAVWCGPCKYMDKYVFTDAQVARYFNEHFINYKLDVDVEKQLAVNFEIEAMPTYLFVDADEAVVFRKTGAMDAEAFLKLGKNALEIPNLEKQYQSGDRSPAFIQKYLLAFSENVSPIRQVIADEYFANLDPGALLEEANFDLLAAYVRNPAAPAFTYYLDHLAEFTEKFEDKAGAPAFNALDALYNEAIETQSEAKLQDLNALLDRIPTLIAPDEAARMKQLSLGSYLEAVQDWPRFAEVSIDFLEKYGQDDFEMLMKTAYNFYLNVDKPESLSKVLAWIETSVQTEATFVNLYLQAALQKKLGQKEKALTSAQASLKAAQEQETDTEMIEQLINEIRQL